jgi:class 3 adenylate cyclase
MSSSVAATFVFTDLVDSTAIAARLGPQAAEEFRQTHFRLLRAAIMASGGTEVKSTGDGLMVMYSSPSRALAGAVGMQQAMAGRPLDAEPMAIRVGVAFGECEVGDGDYFGVAVVEAARLCARAEGGEILATALVRTVAQPRSAVELEPVGALDLKGIGQPVETFRVLWSRIDPRETGPSLPARLASSLSGIFVGREDERTQLLEGWKAASDGAGGRVMLVSGEPGIGKTTLAARVASEIAEQGVMLVYGRIDDGLGVPYQPWIEALEPLVADAPELVLAAHVGARGAHLARLVPALARRLALEVPSGGDGETERFVLFGCVSDLLARVSEVMPLLVVLDDLHWADVATVQLLRHVASADQSMRVGVLGTFRDSEVGADHPVSELLAALHRERGAVRVALRGLSDTDLLALMEAIAGHEMPDDGIALRDALMDETAGNPFFVSETLRHLAETGAIYQGADGRWVADPDLRAAGLPVSVREVIGRRLARLGADSERVLRLAAVIGHDFDIPVLAAVAHLDEDTVVDLCDAAVAAAVLQTTEIPDRYSFAHALIEHTLYDGQSPSRRARAHFAVAETLEAALGDDPGARAGELARHWSAAVQPTDAAKAIHYAQLAGDRALAQLAPGEALRWYTQALDLLSRAARVEPRQRIELLIGLGTAQRQHGVAAHRDTLLEAAHLADAGDAVDLLVRAVIANNRGYVSEVGVADHERVAVINRALDRLGDSDPANRARLLALASAELQHHAEFEERLSFAQQAVSVARASGDRAALLFAMTAPLTAINAPSTVALRSEWTGEACRIADEAGDYVLRYWAHGSRLQVALDLGDRARYMEHFAVMEQETQRAPQSSIRWNLALHRVSRTVLGGDLAEAERLAELALTVGSEAHEPDAVRLFGVQLAMLRYHQGRLGELVALAEQVLAEAPDLQAFRAALTLMRFHAGAPDQARQMLTADLGASFPLPVDYAWAAAHVVWSDAAFRLDVRDAAPLLRERILPYHDYIVNTAGLTVFPAFAYYLGLLDHLAGRLDEADTWFDESMQLHEQIESPLLVAYTQAAWAALLADRGRGNDRDRAKALADQSLATATSHGYGYVAADARAALGKLT